MAGDVSFSVGSRAQAANRARANVTFRLAGFYMMCGLSRGGWVRSGLAIGFCLSTFTLASAAFSQPRLNLARLRDYTNPRVSSHDRSGANDDGNWKNAIQPGETRTLAEIDGPAVISHIWITIATPAKWHLKEMVLRMDWDGEAQPSVEAPVGDFFGLGLGEYFLYESEVLSVGSQKALNNFFPMPFRRSARITVTNEGATSASAFYFNIDYEKHQSLPED